MFFRQAILGLSISNKFEENFERKDWPLISSFLGIHF